MTGSALSPRLVEAFHDQARSCRSLGSPFTAFLLETIAEKGLPQSRFADRISSWEGDVTSSGHSVPLRTAAAFHQIVLRKMDRNLAALYPPAAGWDDDGRLCDALAAAVHAHEEFLFRCLDSPPQTNEIRRCNAIYPALCHIVSRTGLPIRLSELGASAGLNLLAEQFCYSFAGRTFGLSGSSVKLSSEWKGALPPSVDITVAERRGCDLRPFDLSSQDDRIRLQSYVWPDQPDRMERLRAAIALAADHPFVVDGADAADWLVMRLADRAENTAHVVYHTIAWQYFPEDVKARAAACIEEAGRRAAENSPLFWLSMEADGNRPGACLRLVSWPGKAASDLARVDFHGRWISWLV